MLYLIECWDKCNGRVDGRVVVCDKVWEGCCMW